MDILITGTSDGIGRATAEYFLERGHSVVGFDRKPPRPRTSQLSP